jgi:ADP-ribosylglycohydrolase
VHTTEPRDLLEYEYAQRRESGYDLTALSGPIEAALSDPASSDERLTVLNQQLLSTFRSADWNYVEPDRLDQILATLPVAEVPEPVTDLSDKVHGAWLGRCAGCNLGKPIELGEYWTQGRIRDYLMLAGAWPLDDYIPAMDPMPDGYVLRECWPETTRGNIDASARDDDIDYTMLALHLIERYGTRLRPDDVAAEWLGRMPYMLSYTAERATYRNLINNVAPEQAADQHNPYREWVGALIRADAFGYVNPGNPRQAATEAYQDGCLSHRGNGIYGQMWAAALVAAAFTASDVIAAVRTSLDHIPPKSRLSEALSGVLDLYVSGVSWEQARAVIETQWGAYNWVHTINNACLIAAGLLWGEGDFSKSICLTVIGGWDTDSNGATVGSVAGIIAGRDKIPERWTAPLHNLVHSALAGFDNTEISTLAERTLQVIAARRSTSH